MPARRHKLFDMEAFSLQQKKQMSDSLLLGVVLTLAGGFQDAYSYNGRGGVFANAQTGNIVLLGQNLALGEWGTALRYLFPLLSFLLGVFAAEGIRSLCERVTRLHWRQVILLIEIAFLLTAGVFPESLNMVSNVLLSFACAMQVESFRKFRGIPCATTMCIGNMRSATEHLYRWIRTRDPEQKRRSAHYYFIILVFAVGAAVGALFTMWLGAPSIWIAAGLLLAGFLLMFSPAEQAAQEEP